MQQNAFLQLQMKKAGTVVKAQQGQEKNSEFFVLRCDDCGAVDLRLRVQRKGQAASCEPCIMSRKHSLEHFNLLLCVSPAFSSAPGREEWRRASPNVRE